MTVNGYYIEMVLCTIFGILWYGIFKNILKNLQMKCPSQWLVNYVKQPITKNVFTITVKWYILIAFWVKNRRYCMVLLAGQSFYVFVQYPLSCTFITYTFFERGDMNFWLFVNRSRSTKKKKMFILAFICRNLL